MKKMGLSIMAGILALTMAGCTAADKETKEITPDTKETAVPQTVQPEPEAEEAQETVKDTAKEDTPSTVQSEPETEEAN